MKILVVNKFLQPVGGVESHVDRIRWWSPVREHLSPSRCSANLADAIDAAGAMGFSP